MVFRDIIHINILTSVRVDPTNAEPPRHSQKGCSSSVVFKVLILLLLSAVAC